MAHLGSHVSIEASASEVLVLKHFPDDRYEVAEAEASWLAAADGVQGVVDLVRRDGAVVVTRHAGSATLRSAPPPPVDAAHVLAGVAQTLGELAELGLRHGNLTPDHIIIDAGQPSLCSPAGDRIGLTKPATDLQALGTCCRHLLAVWKRQGLDVKRETQWLQLAHRLEEGDETLSPARTTAHFRFLGRPHSPRLGAGAVRSLHRSARVRIAVVVLLVVSTLAAGVTLNRESTESSGPTVLVDAMLLQVGQRQGSAIVLDPRCVGQPAIVLLDQNHQVWSFATSRPGTEGIGVAVVPGAAGLEVTVEDGCASVTASGPAGAVALDMLRP